MRGHWIFAKKSDISPLRHEHVSAEVWARRDPFGIETSRIAHNDRVYGLRVAKRAGTLIMILIGDPPVPSHIENHNFWRVDMDKNIKVIDHFP